VKLSTNNKQTSYNVAQNQKNQDKEEDALKPNANAQVLVHLLQDLGLILDDLYDPHDLHQLYDS
jgi:hypothetical protein